MSVSRAKRLILKCWAVEVFLDVTHRVTSEETWILSSVLIQNITCICLELEGPLSHLQELAADP
jgi:hypothetical protein